MQTAGPHALGGRLWLAGPLLRLGAGCWPGKGPEPVPGLRAVWVHPGHIDTAEKADAVDPRLVECGLNAILAVVWLHGHAYSESALLPPHPRLAAGSDALA